MALEAQMWKSIQSNPRLQVNCPMMLSSSQVTVYDVQHHTREILHDTTFNRDGLFPCPVVNSISARQSTRRGPAGTKHHQWARPPAATTNWFLKEPWRSSKMRSNTEYSTHALYCTVYVVCGINAVRPQSIQSAGPVCFLIFCSISIILLASLVAGRSPQYIADAD